MNWFGEIIMACVSYPGQQIYTVILDGLRERIWIHHYVIPREKTTVTLVQYQITKL